MHSEVLGCTSAQIDEELTEFVHPMNHHKQWKLRHLGPQ